MTPHPGFGPFSLLGPAAAFVLLLDVPLVAASPARYTM
jgi:hypothetical protein